MQEVIRRLRAQPGEDMESSEARDRKREEVKGTSRRHETRTIRGDGRSTYGENCQSVCVERFESNPHPSTRFREELPGGVKRGRGGEEEWDIPPLGTPLLYNQTHSFSHVTNFVKKRKTPLLVELQNSYGPIVCYML